MAKCLQFLKKGEIKGDWSMTLLNRDAEMAELYNRAYDMRMRILIPKVIINEDKIKEDVAKSYRILNGLGL